MTRRQRPYKHGSTLVRCQCNLPAAVLGLRRSAPTQIIDEEISFVYALSDSERLINVGFPSSPCYRRRGHTRGGACLSRGVARGHEQPRPATALLRLGDGCYEHSGRG